MASSRVCNAERKNILFVTTNLAIREEQVIMLLMTSVFPPSPQITQELVN
jgi:hypothetical protein